MKSTMFFFTLISYALSAQQTMQMPFYPHGTVVVTENATMDSLSFAFDPECYSACNGCENEPMFDPGFVKIKHSKFTAPGMSIQEKVGNVLYLAATGQYSYKYFLKYHDLDNNERSARMYNTGHGIHAMLTREFPGNIVRNMYLIVHTEKAKE